MTLLAQQIGPALRRLNRAYEIAEDATAYPQLRRNAEALSDLAQFLGDVVLWPLDNASEQLAGAAVLVGQGRVRVRRMSTALTGERVLLVGIAAVSPTQFNETAAIARRMNASAVYACGIDVDGASECAVESFYPLADRTARERRIA